MRKREKGAVVSPAKPEPLSQSGDSQAETSVGAVRAGMHDSGHRQSFATGAVRDTAEEKPRPDLFSPFAEERVGEWLRLGAVKYTERNWEHGIPNSRCFASLRRHAMRYQQGDRSEDHLAAVIFNAMAIIHNEEMIRRDVLPAELDDMPTYRAAVATETETV